MGGAFKQMRYRVYILESRLGYQRHQLLLRSHSVFRYSSRNAVCGCGALPLRTDRSYSRDKTADDGATPAKPSNYASFAINTAIFIITDRVDLALAADADGVHLGSRTSRLPSSDARTSTPDYRSTTNPEEMQRAIQEGADYIGVGPVYETPTVARVRRQLA